MTQQAKRNSTMPGAAMTDSDVARLAEGLANARQTGAALLNTPQVRPTSDADAYRIQDAVMARLGVRAGGWKVGAASPSALPNCAPIFADAIVPAASAVRGQTSTGVELEIAFTLTNGFAAGPTAPTRDQVEADIASAQIVLETCASRLTDGMQAPEHLRLADFGTNLGLVLGPKLPNWRDYNPKTLVATVEANAAVIAETNGGHTHPDLVGLLTWLVQHCVSQRGGIAAGSVVTTGSWMGIRWVETPVTIVGSLGGLGRIETRIS
jgi:2-keto-4-pentenoate hydratase